MDLHSIMQPPLASPMTSSPFTSGCSLADIQAETCTFADLVAGVHFGTRSLRVALADTSGRTVAEQRIITYQFGIVALALAEDGPDRIRFVASEFVQGAWEIIATGHCWRAQLRDLIASTQLPQRMGRHTRKWRASQRLSARSNLDGHIARLIATHELSRLPCNRWGWEATQWIMQHGIWTQSSSISDRHEYGYTDPDSGRVLLGSFRLDIEQAARLYLRPENTPAIIAAARTLEDALPPLEPDAHLIGAVA